MLSQNELKSPKKLPVFGSLFEFQKSDVHAYVESVSNELGGIFLLKLMGIKLTCITDDQLIKELLRDRPHNFRRSIKLDAIMREAGINGVFNAEGEDWVQQRRLVARSLDVKHVKSFLPILTSITKRLLTKWQTRDTNVQKDLMRLTVDVTTNIVFGVDLDTINAKGGVIQDALEKIFPVVFSRLNAAIPWYKLVKTKKDKEFELAVKEVAVFAEQLIDEAKTNKTRTQKTFLDVLLEELDGESISNEVLLGNMMTLLLAGEDTTAHSIAWALNFLVNHPEWQEKLLAEINVVFENDSDENDYDKYQSLKLMDAFIKESMRLKPVAPILLFAALKDGELGGQYAYKEGELFLTQLRHQSLLEHNFTDAQKFYPYRWLQDATCPVHNSGVSTPFGSGSRFCPGMNLALLEMKVFFVFALREFVFVKGKNYQEPKENMAFVMIPENLDIQLERR